MLTLSPSSAERWLRCTASPGYLEAVASELPPEVKASWTAEGEIAHEIGANMLKGVAPKENDPLELVLSVSEYVRFVNDKRERAGPDHIFFVETKVPLWYNPSRNGVVDSAIITPTTIYICDYKNGAGVVEVRKNPQLAIYARSLVEDMFNKGYDFDGNTLITLAVVQPNAQGDTFKLWVVSLKELIEFTDDIAKVAAAILANPAGGVYAPSDATCRFCPAKKICTKRQEWLMGTLPPEMKAELEKAKPQLVLPSVSTLSVEQVAKFLDAAAPLETFFKDIRDHAYALLNAGTSVPGWKIVEGKASRDWAEVELASKMLGKELKVDEYRPRVMVSPAQAEKLLKGRELSEKFQKEFKDMIVRMPGKPTLVQDSDKCPALTVTGTFKNLDAQEAESMLA